MRFQSTVAAALSGLVLAAFLTTARADEVAGTRYARFRVDDREVYGIVQGQGVREIAGDLFGEHQPIDRTHALTDVELTDETIRPEVVVTLGPRELVRPRDAMPFVMDVSLPTLPRTRSRTSEARPCWLSATTCTCTSTITVAEGESWRWHGPGSATYKQRRATTR